MLTSFKSSRLQQLVEALHQAGAEASTVRGPFPDSEQQLSLRLANGISVSVMTDIDTPALYEVVSFDESMRVLGEKLTLPMTVELIAHLGRTPHA
jgi:hypothetical protein